MSKVNVALATAYPRLNVKSFDFEMASTYLGGRDRTHRILRRMDREGWDRLFPAGLLPGNFPVSEDFRVFRSASKRLR
jgi:hypothetical protein